jgi:transcription factor 1
MEPEELYAEEFINPLLQKPGSKYRHSKLPFLSSNGFVYNHPYAQALEEARATRGMKNIPTLSTSTREYDDPRLRLLNAKLLMTGNLARIYPGKRPQSILMREVIAALDNSGIHRNGLVRQLWWVPETPKVKTTICPQIITGRSSATTMLALAADMTEVAGVGLTTRIPKETQTNHHNARGRNAMISRFNREQVLGRTHASGMRIPTGRKVLQHPSEPDDKDVELKNPHTIIYHTVEEVDAAITEFSTWLDPIRSVVKNETWSSPQTPLPDLQSRILYPQCIPAAVENAAQPSTRHVDGITGLVQRKAIYLDMMLRMISLETHVVHLRDQNLPIGDLKERLAEIDLELHGEKFLNLASTREACTTILEDQLLHFSVPQNFPYDRRTFEPLLADRTDFWPPQTGLALYSSVPSPVDLDVWDIAPRSEVAKLARELAKLLFNAKGTSLPTALDRIAPNAAMDLVPKCPSLSDPRLGGRLDVGNLAVRMVGERGFEELVRAWFEWPFKLGRFELEMNGFRGRADGGGV